MTVLSKAVKEFINETNKSFVRVKGLGLIWGA